ncbi:MAG: SPFH domain-containing protein [Promethearchaeota archaeon]|jgi:regulator of protease activity HflC (stomatin/prohibitin superfamily)
MNMFILIGCGVAAFFILILLLMSLFTVKQQTIAVLERFGKFIRLASPGLHVKIPLIDKIVSRTSLRIFQLDVDVETKTKDNVFVNTKVSVQYVVLDNKVREAYYKLNKPTRQITSYVFDLVRAEIPKLTLDEVFEKKDNVADAVKAELSEVMDDFGYGIIKALVTDIDPDSKVKSSMNEINAAERLRVAAEAKGEADKVLQVKKAEAEAESKKLQGQGIADQRKAIVDGLKDSVKEFQAGVEGSTAQDVMNLVLITQYFDMLKDLGDKSRTNTVFVDHSPGGMADVKRLLATALKTDPTEGE